MSNRRFVLSVAVFVSVLVWTAHAQNPPPVPPLKVDKIQDGLYLISGDGGNVTALVTDEGIVLVDTKNDRNHDELVGVVKAFGDKPIKYVVNTHVHGDHTGGNQQLLPVAQIIGHVNVRSAMIRGKLPGPPPLTYADRMSIFLGGEEVVLRHFGRCHTDGDTFVYFPARKVLVTGDCFNTGNGRGLNPTGATTMGFYADYNNGGSFVDWPKAADSALKLDWDIVIPGHGPPTNRTAFLKWRTAVDALGTRMRSMLREGRTKADVEQMIVAEFGWETTGASFRSIEAMLAELKQEGP